MTHPKDEMVREGDIWSPFKNTRVQNQERNELRVIETGSQVIEEELQRHGRQVAKRGMHK